MQSSGFGSSNTISIIMINDLNLEIVITFVFVHVVIIIGLIDDIKK